MSGAMLIDGIETDALPADDRGLAYGDGLFETLWVQAGRPRLWRWHLARLTEGCRRLGLPRPDDRLLRAEIRQLTAHHPEAIVRLSLTRGSGPRGYAPPALMQPRRILAASVPAADAAAREARPLRLRYCGTRWSIQPQLAGIKHLNRLEQVLARGEWHDPGIDEGLMLDMEGRVISATAANLFVVVDGRCLTPALHRCGVAGVARAWLLSRCADIEVRDISMDDMAAASELCLSSSVRGVRAVAALAAQRLAAGPWTQRLQAEWRSMVALHTSGEDDGDC